MIDYGHRQFSIIRYIGKQYTGNENIRNAKQRVEEKKFMKNEIAANSILVAHLAKKKGQHARTHARTHTLHSKLLSKQTATITHILGKRV